MTSRTDDIPLDLAPIDAGDAQPAGAALGGVALLLRLEGAIVLTVAVLAYRGLNVSFWWFAGLFLLPDLGLVGYLANPRLGAGLYNAAHTYLAPATLALIGWSLGFPVLALALIWTAHIGFDRLMGYGLKYRTAFGATHLGWRGKRETVAIGH